MMRVTKLVMTCGACPSQWEGETDDGRFVYVRYRHGCLTVSVAKECMGDAVRADPVCVVYHGNDMDGSMDEAVLAELTPEIEWPK